MESRHDRHRRGRAMSWQYRRRRKVDSRQLAMTFTPQGMRTFGFWTEIGAADKPRKRVIVRCRCGRTATVSIDELEFLEHQLHAAAHR
jgi:hypothetical protein